MVIKYFKLQIMFSIMFTGFMLLAALYQNGLLSSLLVERRVYMLNDLHDLEHLPPHVRIHGYPPAWESIIQQLPDEVRFLKQAKSFSFAKVNKLHLNIHTSPSNQATLPK